MMMDEQNEKFISHSNRAWEDLSSWWDNAIADGDQYHRTLIFPNVLKLIEKSSKLKILDLGCGNGALSRRIFNYTDGADILGVDVSDGFIKRALERSLGTSIRYQTLDATNLKSLLQLAEQEQFNYVVCSMVLHDLPTIEPIIQSLWHLLLPGGYFIFTLPHPCFNSGEVKFDFLGEPPSIGVSRYIKSQHLEVKSKKDQPTLQHVFHRSLSEIFNRLFKAGMVLDGFYEPAVCGVTEEETLHDWKNLPEVPPALICRWAFLKAK